MTADEQRKLYRGDPEAVARRLASSDGIIGPVGPQGPPGQDSQVEGPPGPPGAQGPPGPQGVQGDRGPAGRDGINFGGTGPQGPQGEQGPQGDPGVSDEPGPEGPRGEVGPPGPQGVTGFDSIVPGPRGFPGEQGEEGPPGPQGPIGVQGIQGERGPAGIQGVAGAQGPMGPQGAASYSVLAQPFSMPAPGNWWIAYLAAPAPFSISQVVTIGNLGFLLIGSVAAGGLNLVVQNLDLPENAEQGAVALAGDFVLGAGARGAQGLQGDSAEPGPWDPVQVDPGWLNSTLRVRLTNGARSVEISGGVDGTLAANALAQVCTLAAAYRPVAIKRFAVAVTSGTLASGFGFLEVQPGGAVLVRPAIAMERVYLDGLSYPLD